MRCLVVVTSLLLACKSPALNVEPPQLGTRQSAPQASSTAQPQAVTGEIRGRVTASDTHAAIAGVDVELIPHLTSEQLRLQMGGLRRISRNSNTTDADGYFRITGLSAGTHGLLATRNGYLKGTFGSSPEVTLADGEQASRAIILIPEARIEGQITDGSGKSRPGLRVLALAAAGLHGQFTFESRWESRTDGAGRYQIAGLPGGRYYVSADTRGPGVDCGQCGQGTADLSKYVRTFYPGVARFTDAKSVAVARGQSASGIDFHLVAARNFAIRGIVTDEMGKPLPNLEVLMVQIPHLTLDSIPLTIRNDGTFGVSAVPSGEYLIEGRADAGFASVPVTVTDHDVIDMKIVLARGNAEILGRVIFPTGSTGDLASSGARLSAVLANAASPLLSMPGGVQFGPFPVAPDGSFQAKGVTGSVLFSVDVRGARVQTVRRNGIEFPDTIIDLKPGEHLDNIEIVLTDRPPEGFTLRGNGYMVTGLSGACPILSFIESDRVWTTNAATVFGEVTCETLRNSTVVDIEGVTQEDGSVLTQALAARPK